MFCLSPSSHNHRPSAHKPPANQTLICAASVRRTLIFSGQFCKLWKLRSRDFDFRLEVAGSITCTLFFCRTAMKRFHFTSKHKLRPLIVIGVVRGGLMTACTLAGLFSLQVSAQQSETAAPVVVQPGAPGEPTRTLPLSTRATLPPRSPKDVEFMQGMIMHHAQAVEMTALIAAHTENKDLRLLGARISRSQSDEIKFMERWLQARAEPTSAPMPAMPGMDMSQPMLMPGMLSPKQMAALKKAKGREFDLLFLAGMIQHHNGALIMVKDLFDTAGAGQDAELFNFTTDIDSGQRAEIRIMQSMLGKNP